MGNSKAFLSINRKEAGYRPVMERITDFGEVEQTLNSEDRMLQASRCMDCGVPFCHWSCPLGNVMPEWQDALHKGNWQEACTILSRTNNFPEFTGRVCPALCEKSCVLMLSNQPVTIRENEVAVVEHAFQEGYIRPQPPRTRTGRKVAVIGSGPSGLAAADMLNRKGHAVVVFEKQELPGGLLRFGIPDFKLNKAVIDRRLQLLREEGVVFICRKEIGKDILPEQLLWDYDALCIAIGAEQPRDLAVEGRKLKGIHFALDFLQQQNRIVAGAPAPANGRLSAYHRQVVVIGGGDTGSDCVGTSIRQKATSVTQLEILPQPPSDHNADTPWPAWPNILKTTSSHLEGCTRRWSLSTKRFIGDENGRVTGVEVAEVAWSRNADGRLIPTETGHTEVIPADLVLLSMGYLHPVHKGLLEQLNIACDERGNVHTPTPFRSSVPKVFVAGDALTGASLVVRAIDSGRQAAASIHQFLSTLPPSL